jgi:hypothetical protein
MQAEDELRTSTAFEGIIGQSPLMWEMFKRIRSVAPHYRTVLIAGETGTGKDLAARALHQLSPVSAGRYVVLNCSAVVETLSESELFGHVKGSFTGATQDKAGLFEHAHGGTLFLDEIGDMPLATQAKLLRVLQSREVQRVGALHTPRWTCEGRYEADIPGAISQLSIERLQQVAGVFVRLRKQRRVNLLKPTENSAPVACSRLMDQEKMAAYHDAVQDFMAVVEELTPNNANWHGVYKRVQAAAKRCEELRRELEEAGGGSSDAGEVA